jgi:NAD+ kinase
MAPRQARSRRSVLVVGDRRRAGVAEAVRRHRPFLERTVDLLDVDLEDRVDLARAKADLVLVFGGDGSILHVARRLGRNPLPVLGVNYGRFGYLADVEPGELETAVKRWLSGDVRLVERQRLAVRVLRGGKGVDQGLALNDVVIARDQAGRMVDVDVRIDGRLALGVSGDGLIVATATGSTAHALSAGGPLLEPTVRALVLVPIAPHSLAHRALVLAADRRIELRPQAGREPARVVLDGRPGDLLEPGDTVEVKGSPDALTLVHVSKTTFYDALREKLGWTGRVRPPAARPPGRRS